MSKTEQREPLTLKQLGELLKFHARNQYEDFVTNMYSRHKAYRNDFDGILAEESISAREYLNNVIDQTLDNMRDDDDLLDAEDTLLGELDLVVISEELEKEYEETHNRKHRLWSRNPDMKDLREEINPNFGDVSKITKMYTNGSIELIRGLRNYLQQMFEDTNAGKEIMGPEARAQWTFPNLAGKDTVIGDPFFILDWLANVYELNLEETQTQFVDLINKNRKDLITLKKDGGTVSGKLDQIHKLTVLVVMVIVKNLPAFKSMSKKDHKYITRLPKAIFNVLQIDTSELQDEFKVRV